ncbi:MAG: hypothetical protein Q7R30_06170 [Acidobacteriota bacterium]|nr:hypothetical protein [Acidobacteriota bacterium]
MSRWPLTRGALAAVAALIVTGLGAYFGLVAPKAREIARLEPQVNAVAQPFDPPPVSAVSIGDTERGLWDELQMRVRARFVAAEDQPRALGEATALARAAGLDVTAIALEPAQPQAQAPFAPPPLAANVVTIRLTARHRFADLIDFLDDLHHAKIYVVVASLDVKRAGGELESEIRLLSMRWQQ